MRRPLAILFSVLFLASTGAHASDARMSFLLRQLEKANDPRSRAQAALMLGAAGKPDAVEPLCRASSEPEAMVRTAAIKALSRLPGVRAQACIAARAKDADGDVRQAVASVTGGGVQPASARKPELYVLLAPVNDRSGGKHASVVGLAESELRAALAAKGAVFAPPNESRADATATLQKRKLQGFYLMTHLDPLPGNGVRMTLVCFTYPGRALLGEVSVKASGPPPPDLVRALVPRAVQEAAETFEWGSTQ